MLTTDDSIEMVRNVFLLTTVYFLSFLASSLSFLLHPLRLRLDIQKEDDFGRTESL